MKHFLCITTVLAAPLFAGVRIQMESTDLATGEVTKREILVDSDRIRTNETGKSTNSSVLFLTDGGRNRLVMLDKDKNQYREFDQQTIDRMSGQMAQASPAMAQMQAQMKNMPPEQRAMMEAAMKGRGMTPAAARRTVYTAKGGGTANGFACTKYDGMRGDEKLVELCAASPATLKFTASDFQAYEQMKELLSSLQNMASMASNNSVATLGQSGFAGVPVQQTTFKDGKAILRTDTKSIDRATFNAEDFSLGAAKQVDLMPAQGKQ